MLAIGAEGVVSVAANIVPAEILAMIEAFHAGKLDVAKSLHKKLFPLARDLLGVGPNPVPLKAAMALLERGNGELRLPLTPLEPKGVEAIRRGLVQFGLMSVAGSPHTN
jgi:4-hydroxy-tetrahydrodipicolinate synthase